MTKNSKLSSEWICCFWSFKDWRDLRKLSLTPNTKIKAYGKFMVPIFCSCGVKSIKMDWDRSHFLLLDMIESIMYPIFCSNLIKWDELGKIYIDNVTPFRDNFVNFSCRTNGFELFDDLTNIILQRGIITTLCIQSLLIPTVCSQRVCTLFSKNL